MIGKVAIIEPQDWTVNFTRQQHMALLSFLMDYLQHPEHLDVSIDCLTDVETTPQEILSIVMNATPSPTRRSRYEQQARLMVERKTSGLSVSETHEIAVQECVMRLESDALLKEIYGNPLMQILDRIPTLLKHHLAGPLVDFHN